jgi:hypothetical protein
MQLCFYSKNGSRSNKNSRRASRDALAIDVEVAVNKAAATMAGTTTTGAEGATKSVPAGQGVEMGSCDDECGVCIVCTSARR